MADERIILELDLETGKVISGFKKVEGNAKQSGKRAGENFTDGFKQSLSTLAIRASQIGTLLGTAFAGFATKGAFDAAKAIEGIETRFDVLLGSASAAKKQVQDLVNFAATTPFQLEGLADASAQLLAFGFQQDEIIDRLRTLGDVASGSSSDLKEVALIFGQIRAAGKLTGERLLQLQERAIPIGAAMAKSLGVAESQIRGLVSAGKIGFADVEKALSDLTSAGGLFENATIRQSQTLGGLVSTLKDNFFALQVAIGKALGPAFKVIVTDGISLFQRLTATVTNNVAQISTGFISVARAINNFVVAPAELLINVFKVAQNTINTFVAGAIGGFGILADGAARLIEKFGGGGEFTQGLKDFAASSVEVFQENEQALSESVDNIFNGSVFGNTDEFLNKLQENLDSASSAISDTEISGPNTKGVEDKFAEVNKRILQQTKATGKAIASAINQALAKSTSLGVQALTKSLILGVDGFKNFGKQIFGILGDLSIKLGESLILTGIGIESLKGLSGAAAIAAGAGLVALGTILKSFSGGEGGVSASGGAGTVGAASLGGGVGADKELTVPNEEREPSQNVQLVVQGDILDSEDTGRRLLDLLNDNFEREGSVVTGASFA